MSAKFPKGWGAQLEGVLLSNYYTGCDEMDYYIATEADKMATIVYEDGLNKDGIFTFNRNINLIVLFNCEAIIFFLYL